jgi:hypothetical protein
MQFLCMKMIIHTSTSVICSCLTYLAAASSTRNSCFTKLLTWYSYSSSSCGSNASSKNMCAEIKMFSELILIFSQTCIQRPFKATWKCSLYQQLPFIYRLTLYALFINRESETALYIQWFAIQRCRLMQVCLYLHINCARLFKMLVYIYSFYDLINCIVLHGFFLMILAILCMPCHDITEILLKVALNTRILFMPLFFLLQRFFCYALYNILPWAYLMMIIPEKLHVH